MLLTKRIVLCMSVRNSDIVPYREVQGDRQLTHFATEHLTTGSILGGYSGDVAS